MSSPPVRRADKVMPQAKLDELLSNGYCGHLATISPDGSPYVCPLLYVWLDGQVWLHNTSAHGHLQSNVRHDPRVCFEVSVPGKIGTIDVERPAGLPEKLRPLSNEQP